VNQGPESIAGFSLETNDKINGYTHSQNTKFLMLDSTTANIEHSASENGRNSSSKLHKHKKDPPAHEWNNKHLCIFLYKLGYCGKVSVADMSQNKQTMRNASKF
jgi:hypothetical protein